jgi:hypothetical protein
VNNQKGGDDHGQTAKESGEEESRQEKSRSQEKVISAS